MNNPFESIKEKVEEERNYLRKQIQIDMLRELTAVTLSRLITLDTDNSAKYKTALDAIE